MFTIKKTLASLLLLAFILCFSGCGSIGNEKYKSWIESSFNDEYAVDAEIDVWPLKRYEKSEQREMSCAFLGGTYTAPYKDSYVDRCNSYTTDRYKSTDVGTFGLRSDTGELVFINFMNKNFFETQPYWEDIENPYETAVTMAKDVAAEYVKSIDEYTMITEEPSVSYKERDGITYSITYYNFTFVREIQGYLSSDYIMVRITSKGTVSAVFMGDIGAFEDVKLDFDSSAVEESVAKKIEQTYQGRAYKVSDYRIDEQRIAIAPDGTIYMSSAVFLYGRGSNAASDSPLETTGVYILTVIGER